MYLVYEYETSTRYVLTTLIARCFVFVLLVVLLLRLLSSMRCMAMTILVRILLRLQMVKQHSTSNSYIPVVQERIQQP